MSQPASNAGRSDNHGGIAAPGAAQVMWAPSAERAATTAMARFITHVQNSGTPQSAAVHNAQTLQHWSIAQYQAFWRAVLDFCNLDVHGNLEPILAQPADRAMFGSRFFPEAKLNFAANLLHHAHTTPDATAIISMAEGVQTVKLTYAELRDHVTHVAQRLRALGIQPGDRVAAFVPNVWQVVVMMLASASIGAVWSSCSPDFGVQGVVDRFGQIAPKVLLVADGYRYNGKAFRCDDKVAKITNALPSLQHLVTISWLNSTQASKQQASKTAPKLQRWTWESFAASTSSTVATTPSEPDYTLLPFNHPLAILYSSGTTGVPKCIVHGAGGTLLQHAKEHVLHGDLQPGDNLFYFTTCGWMMWNWLVSGLLTGASITLYDGSPSHPNLTALWQAASTHRVTHFGTSPKFMQACIGAGVHPAAQANIDLSALRVVFSTGAPLLPEHFDWIYQQVKSDVQLSSISGGTDIISCFMLGHPMLPVHRGQIQTAGLGMDIAAVAHNGHTVVENGQKGELACRTPFPSMPVRFWNDPDGQRYRRAYFAKSNKVWLHGDFVSFANQTSGITVHGRSDATLNPGGVRIGTAEIYRLVETMPEVSDSLVIGQPWQGDVRVVLFVQLHNANDFDDTLVSRIKKTIRSGATPRHVPAVILPVAKIPYTISGKKVELAVLQVIQGQEPGNTDAFADPSALDCYRNLPQLEAPQTP